MTSTIDAARRTQSRPNLQTVYRCETCDRALSVAEFIERHCEGCGTDCRPVAVKERAA
jgi:hypothetical protein